MSNILYGRWFHISLAGGLIIVALGLLIQIFKTPEVPRVSTAVERGSVAQIVSVSGVVEAEDLAQLAFPTTGIVREVLVEKGSRVEAGDVLISLTQSSLLADRTDALAALTAARADRDELIAGPREEARIVTATEVTNAMQSLERITSEQAEKVENARKALLSNSLIALTDDGNESAAPPTVTGTYTCDTEGLYTLAVYASAARSGYSYQLSGLESGIYPATTDQSAPLGSCGLRIQFATDQYDNSQWTVQIPNTTAPTYTTLKNAYDLAIEQAENEIAAAENALLLAKQQAELTNAEPRTEALTRANAAVAQAAARLARIDAELGDRILVAPFAGIISAIDILPGETVTATPVITLIAENAYELTARIPEIDVTKVLEGQRAEVLFDAKDDTLLDATITFISPTATEIDGVAYYEAILELNEPPTWLRSGLNADVDIIVAEATDTLRVPKRFVKETDGIFTVLQRRGNIFATTTVDIGLVGNDGFIEIIGIAEGDILIAP